jgi:hypothetical protein
VALRQPLQGQDDVQLPRQRPTLMPISCSDCRVMLRSLMPMRPAHSASVLCRPAAPAQRGQAAQARVARYRQVQVFHGRGRQLVEQGGHQAFLRAMQHRQGGESGCLGDQLAQQGRDGHGAADGGQGRRHGRLDEQTIAFRSPTPCVACIRPPGIHTAHWGGTIHTPLSTSQ